MPIAPPPRTRATRPDDKAERYAAILNAAEALLRSEPDRVSVMADVAAAAGIAKGTVYLYFASKEELLLALHERHVETFFNAMNDRLARDTPADWNEIMAITRTHILAHPTYLACASMCMGSMERSTPVAAVADHMSRVAGWLQQAGTGLERHFKRLQPGQGVLVLRDSYALLLGMWQMLKPDRMDRIALDANTSRVLRGEYGLEVERALWALWSGHMIGSPRANPLNDTNDSEVTVWQRT
jgi:AcrR family transcriptional regulator